MAMVHTTISTDLSRKLRMSSSSGSGLILRLMARAPLRPLLARLTLLECRDRGPDRREWTEPEEKTKSEQNHSQISKNRIYTI